MIKIIRQVVLTRRYSRCPTLMSFANELRDSLNEMYNLLITIWD